MIWSKKRAKNIFLFGKMFAISKVRQILKKALIRSEATLSKRTGGSDAADVSAFGIPCVDSLGVVGGYIHSPKEMAYIDSLVESAKRLVLVVKNI